MMKFTKRFSALFCAVILVFCAGITAFAESTNKLTDDADLFLSYEDVSIEQMLEDASDETGWDVVIYTNYNGVESYDMKEYCHDYYLDNNLGVGIDESGVMLNIDMSSRQMYIYTYGDTMDYFSDYRVDSILDDVQAYLSDDEFYSAAESFISTTCEYYHAGIDDSEPNYNAVESSPEEKNFVGKLLYVLKHYGIIIGIVAVAIGALSVVYTMGHYKNHGKEGTYDLKANSSTTLYGREDVFLHKSVSVTTVSSSSSSGGRSSGGGGGRTSGGGGGRSF